MWSSLALVAFLPSRRAAVPPPPELDQRIFIKQEVTRARLEELASRRGLYPLEPALGCYIGAFIAKEDALRLIPLTDDGRDAPDPKDFEKIVKKRHAVYFNYMGLNAAMTEFPLQEATLMKTRNVAFHIALEPGGPIAKIVDDGPDCRLRKFARAAASCGAAVFIRFGSEMNGGWTHIKDSDSDWGADPEVYKQKFRLIAKVCREEMHTYRVSHLKPDGTPPPANIALVWSPSPYANGGVKGAARWYPGDDVVDWVGVNFYSVLTRSDGTGRSSEFENPLDTVRQVVEAYGAKHPIMIAEWAATHQHYSNGKPDKSGVNFAVNKLGQLYGGLPLIYPQVKCVNYFSMNAEHAQAGRKINDFSLLGTPKFSTDDTQQEVADQYVRLISNPYYLAKVEAANQRSTNLNSHCEYVALANGQALSGDLELRAFVRSDVERPAVEWIVGGKKYAPSNSPSNVPSDYLLDIPAGNLPAGKLEVKLVVHNRENTSVVTRTVLVQK